MANEADLLAETIKAATELLYLNPVFRARPVGGERSAARLHQQDLIAAEDKLRAIIAKAKSS